MSGCTTFKCPHTHTCARARAHTHTHTHTHKYIHSAAAHTHVHVAHAPKLAGQNVRGRRGEEGGHQHVTRSIPESPCNHAPMRARVPLGRSLDRFQRGGRGHVFSVHELLQFGNFDQLCVHAWGSRPFLSPSYVSCGRAVLKLVRTCAHVRSCVFLVLVFS